MKYYIATDNIEPFLRENASRGPPWWRSQRYILAYLLMSGMVNLFFQRTNISIAVICMVNHTALRDPSDVITLSKSALGGLSHDQVTLNSSLLDQSALAVNTSGHGDTCEERDVKDKEEEDGPFLWDKSMQGSLLSSLYWTYLGLQIPGGIIIGSLNKKTVILCAQLVMAALSMCVPEAAYWSPWAVVGIRLAQGGCTALTVLAMFGMWTKWAPPSERASLLSIHVLGQVLGNCLVFPMSAWLCNSGLLGGWPSVFYVHGCIGFVWVTLFFVLADDSPEHHRFITVEEREYLRTTVSSGGATTEKPPYLAMVKSAAFWGASCSGFSFCWGLFLLMSTLPQYMKEVLKLDIQSNGVLSMLPFIAFGLVIQITGPLSDVIINRKWMSTVMTRRVYVTVGNIVPAVLLAVMSHLDCTQTTLAVVMLTVAVGATGFSQTASLVNIFDISGHLAVPTRTLVNTIATIPGVVVPYAVTAITKDESRAQWQTVFYMTSGVFVAGTVGFWVLGRGHVQKWALPDDLNVVEVNKNNKQVGNTKR